jgi:uncharacterized membrane protein (DUF4010 family)
MVMAAGVALLVLMLAVGAGGGVVAAAYGLTITMRVLKAGNPDRSQIGRAFSVKTALVLVGAMSVMLVVAAGLKDRLGEAGITVGAAIAGVVDAHSTAISVASLAASGKIAPQDAVAPILAALTTNAGAKCVMAVSAGSRAFAIRVVLGVALSIAAARASTELMIFH